MNTRNESLDVSNLSSRKLWELLNIEVELCPQQKYLVELELRARRHYLPELNERQKTTLH